jgi:hypothetical protein
MRKAELDYLEEIKTYAESKGLTGEVKISFSDGYCGLEDMTFPHWTVTIGEHRNSFADQVRYGRMFGNTSFINCSSNQKIVKDWIDTLVNKDQSNA